LNVLSLRDSSSANTVAPLVSCHSLRNYIYWYTTVKLVQFDRPNIWWDMVKVKLIM